MRHGASLLLPRASHVAASRLAGTLQRATVGPESAAHRDRPSEHGGCAAGSGEGRVAPLTSLSKQRARNGVIGVRRLSMVAASSMVMAAASMMVAAAAVMVAAASVMVAAASVMMAAAASMIVAASVIVSAAVVVTAVVAAAWRQPFHP